VQCQPFGLDREVALRLQLQVDAVQFEDGASRRDADTHRHTAIACDDLDDVTVRTVFDDESLAGDQFNALGVGTSLGSVDWHGG
jgi:hypothetical protein